MTKKSRSSMGSEKGVSKHDRKSSEKHDGNDARFSEVAINPKFSRRPKDQSKLKVDPRFSKMFTDEGFTEQAPKVDKYGRKLSKKERTRGHDLKRLYDVEDKDEVLTESKVDDTEEMSPKKSRKAKESKGKEGQKNGKLPAQGRKQSREDYLSMLARGEIQGVESDDSSDSDSNEEEQDLAVADQAVDKDVIMDDDSEEDIPVGEATARIAVQNLDWARISAQDIIAVLQSFLPVGGSVSKVTVYQSEFGEKRMAEEDTYGPRVEGWNTGPQVAPPNEDEYSNDDDDDRAIEDEFALPAPCNGARNNDDDLGYDKEAVRKYERNKLKYYFAIAEFDSVETADKIYAECDGVEFLRTSVIFDLRFVPDDVIIERPVREVATSMSDDYEAPNFVTKALQNTSVELTWDEDDDNRKNLKRWKDGANVKGRQMIGERDLEAFIASDIESSEDESDEDNNVDNAKMSKQRLRAALLGNSDGSDEKDVSDNDDDVKDEEQVFEMKYVPELDQRLKNKATGNGADSGENKRQNKDRAQDNDMSHMLPKFDDPFFKDPIKEGKKKRRQKQQEDRDEDDDHEFRKTSGEEQRKRDEAELELLLLKETKSGKDKGLEGFDFKTISVGEKFLAKGGKMKGRSAKKRKLKEALKVAEEDDFKIDTADDRFKSFYEDTDYSVDRTSSQYKGTRAMAELEKAQLTNRTKNKNKRVKNPDTFGAGGDNDLQAMVASVKLKSKAKKSKK